MSSVIDVLKEIPGGAWGVLGVGLGYLLNAWKDKRLARERAMIREEDRKDAADKRHEDREATWRQDRLDAHASFAKSVRPVLDALTDYISSNRAQEQALAETVKARAAVEAEIATLEMIVPNESANAAHQCRLSIIRTEMFLREYKGRPNLYIGLEFGEEPEDGYFENPHRILEDVEESYWNFVPTARATVGLEPVAYSGRGL